MGSTELVRPLGLAGVASAVVTERHNPVSYSRFVRAVIEWPDAGAEPAALVARLLRFAATQPCPPVLFYEQDPQLLLVARYRDRLARGFRFVLPDPALVEALVDKGRFASLAERLSLPVPPTRRIDPARSAAGELRLRFPLILKPLTRGEDWAAIGGGAKALMVESPAALRDLWPHLAAAKGGLLAQEMIPGPESAIESYHVYVDATGAVVAEFTGRKIRTFPLALGHSTALEITEARDVVTIGRDVVERLGLKGVAKLDFKRGPDGRLHLLEVNPRFNLWHHLGAVAGINLPALVHADLAGLPRPPIAVRPRVGARWCWPTKDIHAARAAGMPLASWLPWALGCDAKAVLAWDDPRPVLQSGLRRLLSRRPRPGDDGAGRRA
jgi:predicted ATP-grasp superfamily ATP-dependent carboligase